MRRMHLDFSKTKSQILTQAQQIVPDTTASDLDRWDSQGAVESMVIDGERRYFNRAAANVFRLHPEARERKALVHPGLDPDISCWLGHASELVRFQTNPPARRFLVEYKLSVHPNAVPSGETVRAWLPFPHRAPPQKDIRLLTTSPPNPILSPVTNALSSLYLEQAAVVDQPTVFTVTFEFSTQPTRPWSDSTKAPADRGVSPADLLSDLQQRPPQIIFTPDLQTVSASIVGNEKDPTTIASKLFDWVSRNIPWAGAREYSTLESLTDYALANRHGDCGIQTMLFISLCRLNGIPARWESGWMVKPSPNLHDWCRIYLPNQGWIPVDVSFGIMPTQDPGPRYFYFGGFDGERMIVNTDHDQPLHPPKKFFRSEIVDFQRGEVEWQGGNLYFDQWDYDCKFTPIPPMAY